MVRLATNRFFRFRRKCFGMKVGRRFHKCTYIKCPLCLGKMQTPVGPFWSFFDWLHGLGRLLIGGLPRNETDHPTINHRWSVRRARFFAFSAALVKLLKLYIDLCVKLFGIWNRLGETVSESLFVLCQIAYFDLVTAELIISLWNFVPRRSKNPHLSYWGPTGFRGRLWIRVQLWIYGPVGVGGGHLLCGPYWGCAAPKGHFLIPDTLAKGVFLAKIP